ncbi:hypothetical protein PTKIN_Ptkin11bG0087700 [Pterospermum kingtungense]
MIELGITGPEGHALSRPAVLEGEATARAIPLASFMNTPLYVVHVMSFDAMEEIAKARKSDATEHHQKKVIGEPVVSGLVLDDSVLWDPDFITAAKYAMSPPIRESGHNKALQAALSTGVLQLVGTNHCTFNSTPKASASMISGKFPMVSMGEVGSNNCRRKSCWQDNELKVVPGSGKYKQMPPFSYLCNGIHKADSKFLSSLKAPIKRFKSAA